MNTTNKTDYVVIPNAHRYQVVKVEWYGPGRFKPLETISSHFRYGQALAEIHNIKNRERYNAI